MSYKDQVELVASLREKGFTDTADHMFAVIHDLDQQLLRVIRDVDELKEKMLEVTKAFPDSDLHGHRLYHERLIRSMMANEGMMNTVKTDIITKMVLVAIAAIATVLGIKLGLG